MGVGFSILGQADPAGISTPDKFVQRIAKWSRRATGCLGFVAKEQLYPEAARPFVTLQFFAAAEPVEFILEAPGLIRVTAATTSMGPGYHQWLCDDVLERLANSLGIKWFPDDGDTCHDETGYFYKRDRTQLEQSFLDWIAATADQVRHLSAQDHTD